MPSELLAGTVPYLLMLALVALPTALTLWLLRTRWLVHLPGLAPLRAGVGRQSAVGALTALAVLAATLALAATFGGFSRGAAWQPYEYLLGTAGPSLLPELLLFFLLQTLAEELTFRVLGMGLLAMLLLWLAELTLLPPPQRRFGRPAGGETLTHSAWHSRLWLLSGLLANAVVAVGFGISHMRNPEATPLAGVNIALAGLWLGLLFWRYGSVWAVWAGHFAWNFALALLALPVSGMALAKAPLGVGFSGARAGLVSGGAFGPEGSVFCTLALLLVNALLLHAMWRDARGSTSPNPGTSGSA